MDEERKYCVYKHTSPYGKVYIGQTCQNPKRRWMNGLGYKNNLYFYRAIQKYGWDNFEHIIIVDNLTLEEANYLEEALIKELDSTNPNKGYNIKFGGDNNTIPDEVRKKMSESRSGEKNHRYGKHWSENERKKISESTKGRIPWNKGIPMSDEQKEKMSLVNKGRKVSDETRKKISESNKGEKSCSAKMIVQLDKEYNFIRMWKYIRQASNELHIHEDSIGFCCGGKRKTAGGYCWLYVYDQTKRNGAVVQGAISLGYITEEDVEHLKEQL